MSVVNESCDTRRPALLRMVNAKRRHVDAYEKSEMWMMKQMREGGRYEDLRPVEYRLSLPPNSWDDVEDWDDFDDFVELSNDQLEKKHMELAYEIREYEEVEAYILTTVKGGGRYDDILNIHYRQEDDLFSTKAELASLYSNEDKWGFQQQNTILHYNDYITR